MLDEELGPVNRHVEAVLVLPVEAGDVQQVRAMPGERGSESMQTLDNSSNQWYSGEGGSMRIPSCKRYGSFLAP